MIPTPGTVYLVGAGPGDPELITVRGLRLLRSADVVAHDRLVAPELLSEVRAGAEVINVGKVPGFQRFGQDRINQLLIARARAGKIVVRLKGGDPFVFGRGGEESAACVQARIPCFVIPGVSSAVAGPAAAGIPVTHRETAGSFAVVTAVSAGGADAKLDDAALASMDTLVILMGRARLAEIAKSLIAAGRSARTPAACIERATTQQQRVVVAELSTIAAEADQAQLQSPAVTVIGDTVRHARNQAEIAAAYARLAG